MWRPIKSGKRHLLFDGTRFQTGKQGPIKYKLYDIALEVANRLNNN